MRNAPEVRILAWVGVVATLLVGADVRAAAGQAAQRLDRGTFDLRAGGASVGTETFAIRRERGSVRAVGRIQLTSGGTPWRSGQVWLQTDPNFQPQLFRLEPEASGGEMAAAVRQDSRLRVQTTSSAGQRSKEFVACPELSVLHLDVAHHLYILFRQHASALEAEGQVSVPAVLPVHRQRVTLRIQRGQAEEISVAGRTRQAVRHVVETQGARLEVWTDDQGRILRIHYPESGRTAVRTQEGAG